MAFNMVDQTVIPYPRGKEIKADVMFTWFDDLILGRDKSPAEFKTDHRTVVDTEIYSEHLPNTAIVTRDNFTSYILEEGFDSMLLLYTTGEVSDNQRHAVEQFDDIADMLMNKKFLDKSAQLRFGSYDVNMYGSPPGIEYNPRLPRVYFFPAFNKQGPFRQYAGQLDATFILKYLTLNCDKKLDLSKFKI